MSNFNKKLCKLAAVPFFSFIIFNIVLATTTADSVEIKDPLQGKTLNDIIQGIINFIFGLALMICPIIIIWGGFEIATANGAEQKVTAGKQKITYALIGLAVMIMASAFVSVVKNILGVTS